MLGSLSFTHHVSWLLRPLCILFCPLNMTIHFLIIASLFHFSIQFIQGECQKKEGKLHIGIFIAEHDEVLWNIIAA